MDTLDWLFLIHIFKWANFWTAPNWVFVIIWIFAIIESIAKIWGDK